MIDFNTKRHALYNEYEKMYSNLEDEWLGLRDDIEGAYLPLALPREVSQLYSDLAFGNPINAIVKDNKEANTSIDEIIEDNELDLQLSEASLSQSYKGGVVAKNYLDQSQSKITFIEADYYFPQVSPTDKRKILSETIAIPFSEGKDKYLHTEKYDSRNGEYWCVTQTFTYANGEKGKPISEAVEINTKLTQSPLTYVPFVRSNGNFWGDSLYKGITPLFDTINHRVTQINNVLDTHSDPNMWAVSSLFDDDGNLQVKGSKVYEVSEDSEGSTKDPMGYITWNWSADANFKFIDDIIYKALHYVSPLAPALYGLDKSSQASGRAILLKSWRSQCKITRSYQYWRPALKKILFIAQQLQIVSGEKSYYPAIPKIELSLNMPIDSYETVIAEVDKVEAGLTSKKSAISRINPHYTSKEVDEEWESILEEQSEATNQTFMGDMAGFGVDSSSQGSDIDDNDQ